ncbi:hypothetical protein PMIN01_07281 [Paraphaeosphaeria minitans]|uniref:Uncharacterized protein n=1 Tax=Paraphaeosphaeria minitans TaxID=565426 RepID=A0A9P6KP77_9PLEO|nr:hypothetical protein PMIN01_07281 [Paraphaeosphaeria minitans]
MRQAGWDGEVTSTRVEKQGADALYTQAVVLSAAGDGEGGGEGGEALVRMGMGREGATAGCTSPLAPSSARLPPWQSGRVAERQSQRRRKGAVQGSLFVLTVRAGLAHSLPMLPPAASHAPGRQSCPPRRAGFFHWPAAHHGAAAFGALRSEPACRARQCWDAASNSNVQARARARARVASGALGQVMQLPATSNRQPWP